MSRRIRLLFTALALVLAATPATVAAADPAAVIGEGEVGDEQVEAGERAQEPGLVAEPAHEEPASPPAAPAVESEYSRIVVVDTQSDPETAWALASPWERSIEVHGEVGSEPSRIQTHSGTGPPRATQIRVHSAGSKSTGSLAIPTHRFGGTRSRIRVHSGGSDGPSRIRVHGIGGPDD